MLEVGIKQQLKNYLEKITAPVAIVAAVDDSAKSKEMLNLLHEIRALSDNISVTETADASVRTPSFTLGRPGENARIRFAGIPLGHEFSSPKLAVVIGGNVLKVWIKHLVNRPIVTREIDHETTPDSRRGPLVTKEL